MKLTAIFTTWGYFLVHKSGCQFIDNDWNLHGYQEIFTVADNKAQVITELWEAVHYNPALRVKRDRTKFHWCVEAGMCGNREGLK